MMFVPYKAQNYEFNIVRKLGIFSFNLIQKISAIYVMTCMCV
jgi:hypothetical protein